MSSSKNALVDSALHVLKGAVVSVLGTSSSVTTGVELLSSTRATLVVEFGGDASLPSETIAQIEKVANDFVAAKLPIQKLKLTKGEAEAKFANKVNNTFIYDKSGVPSDRTDVNVVLIDGCNVNVCDGDHLSSTDGIISIGIQKSKYRKSRKEYEFTIVVGEAAIHFKNEQLKIDLRKEKGNVDKKEDRKEGNNKGAEKVQNVSTSTITSLPLQLSPSSLSLFQEERLVRLIKEISSGLEGPLSGLSADMLKAYPHRQHMGNHRRWVQDIVLKVRRHREDKEGNLIDEIENDVTMLLNEAYARGYRAAKDLKETKTMDTLLPDF